MNKPNKLLVHLHIYNSEELLRYNNAQKKGRIVCESSINGVTVRSVHNNTLLNKIIMIRNAKIAGNAIIKNNLN